MLRNQHKHRGLLELSEVQRAGGACIDRFVVHGSPPGPQPALVKN